MEKILGLIYFLFFSALKHIVWACHPRIDIASLQHFNRTVCNFDHFRESEFTLHPFTFMLTFKSYELIENGYEQSCPGLIALF